jgi:hypothetical protein
MRTRASKAKNAFAIIINNNNNNINQQHLRIQEVFQ